MACLQRKVPEHYRALRVSIMDTATIQQNISIFFPLPYHKDNVDRMVYTDGHWMYGALVSKRLSTTTSSAN